MKIPSIHNLLGLLNQRFARLQGLPEGPERTRLRDNLAQYFVQRCRPDLQEWQDATVFPDRQAAEVTYALTGDWGRLFDDVLTYARAMVERVQGKSKLQQRMNWWAALALLRCMIRATPFAASAGTPRVAQGRGRVGRCSRRTAFCACGHRAPVGASGAD